MKKAIKYKSLLKFLFSLGLLLLSIQINAQQEKEYGKGVLLLGSFNVETSEVDGKLVEAGKVVKIIKTENKYSIYCINIKGGKVLIQLTKLHGAEQGEDSYVDLEGDVHFLIDKLDTESKTLDFLNTNYKQGTDSYLIFKIKLY